MISGNEAAKVVRTYTQGLTAGGQTTGSKSGTTPPALGTDGISLSAKQSIAHWVAAVASAPDVRSERVQSLQAQVGAGQYRPDAHSIARQILARSAGDNLGASK